MTWTTYQSHRLLLVSFLLVLSAKLGEGFSPRMPEGRSGKTQLGSSLPINSQEEASRLMIRARECAFSDACSVDDAREFLHDVLQVQYGCAADTITGHELCDDQQHIAEIVGNLREKAENGMGSVRTLVAPTSVAIGLSGSVFLMMLGIMTTNFGGAERQAFTFQEWLWAIQGGYLDNMIAHFMRHGGL